ncbi:MAG: hypothetical protein L6305_02810 [Actinomycetia bacterium]|nr:hypothetical protein [Actinomycetes bacterium]
MLCIGGGLDISVGSIMGFSSSLAALFISKNMGIWLAIILTLLAGAAVGLINGLIVTKIKVN